MRNILVIKLLLWPLRYLFGTIALLRNKMFDLKMLPSKQFKFPVIGLGNITVGGTGKTPHVEYLANLLKDDHQVAVLSRGYKRKTRGFIEAGMESDSKQIGDEPMQIKQKFGDDITVAVCEDRVKGINKLKSANEKLDIIILDDVYQHRHVKPGLNILLVDYNRPIFEDKLLPLGNLRESKFNYNRANIILVTKCPDEMKPIDRRIFNKNLNLYPYQRVFFTKMKYGKLCALANAPEVDMEELSDYSVLLVTGIAHPKALKKHLESNCKELISIDFADHHDFKEKDINKVINNFNNITNQKKLIITTEKDAMRLRDNVKYSVLVNNTYYLPINVVFLDGEEENFKKQINNYVREDKRNR